MIEKNFVKLVKKIYKKNSDIQLHEPYFNKDDVKCVSECIKSTFVSSVGKNVDIFAKSISKFTKSKYVIPIVNGTSAIYISLYALGVTHNDEVLVPSYTFVGTCNPILYLGANPVFMDIDKDNLSMCPNKLYDFLKKKTKKTKEGLKNKKTNKIIKCCLVVHPYGFPAEINKLRKICNMFNIKLIEDAAEALGTYHDGKHVGTKGDLSILSFNGNKIITTGGGGAILTQNYSFYRKIKHISSTSLIKKSYYNSYDKLGFNLRMPNLNASLGISQLKKINKYLELKKKVHLSYKNFFKKTDITLFETSKKNKANYWLNTIKFKNEKNKKIFLKYCIDRKIHVKPGWLPVHTFNHFRKYQCSNLDNTNTIHKLIVNLPSSAI